MLLLLQQVNWSNSLYLAQTTPSVVVTDNNAKEGPDGVEWDSGVWKYTVNDAHNAPANVQVL